MISFLESLVGGLFAILEGLLSFLRDLLPLLFKLLFALSPFALLILGSYLYVGTSMTTVAVAASVILAGIGILSYKEDLAPRGKLSREVMAAVVAFDIMIIGAAWYRARTSVAPLHSDKTTQLPVDEGVVLQFLDQALRHNDDGEVLDALRRLDRAKSVGLGGRARPIIERYYDRSLFGDAAKVHDEILNLTIRSIVRSKDRSVCETLIKLPTETNFPAVKESARSAALGLCGKS